MHTSALTLVHVPLKLCLPLLRYICRLFAVEGKSLNWHDKTDIVGFKLFGFFSIKEIMSLMLACPFFGFLYFNLCLIRSSTFVLDFGCLKMLASSIQEDAFFVKMQIWCIQIGTVYDISPTFYILCSISIFLLINHLV